VPSRRNGWAGSSVSTVALLMAMRGIVPPCRQIEY